MTERIPTNDDQPVEGPQPQGPPEPDTSIEISAEHAEYSAEATAALTTYSSDATNLPHPAEIPSGPTSPFERLRQQRTASSGSVTRNGLGKFSASSTKRAFSQWDQLLRQKISGGAEATSEKAPDPLATLRAAIDIGPEARQKLRYAIEDRIDQKPGLYPNNQPLQEQIKKVGDGVYWFYAGEPDDPLPSCFIACPGDYGGNKIIAHPDIDSKLFAVFDPEAEQAHEAAFVTLHGDPARKGRVNRFSNKLEILLGEACEATPAFQLLRSFRDTVPQAADRPLREAEKDARLAAARADVQVRYGLNDTELNAPISDERTHRARTELTAAAFRLEGETVRHQRHQRPPSPKDRAKDFFGRAIIALHRQADPQSSVKSPDQLSTEFGGQHTQMTTLQAIIPVQAYNHTERLDASLISYVGQLNKSTVESPADELAAKAIAQLFKGGEAHETNFDKADSRNLTGIAVHSLLPNNLRPNYQIDVSYAAWLRQPYIADEQIHESEPHKPYPSLYANEISRLPAGLVGSQDFERLQNTSIGSVLIDKRPAEQRHDILLIMTAPVDYSLYTAERPVSPDIKLRLKPGALGGSSSRAASVHPYLPGYRLVYADESGADQLYDFVSDPGNDPGRRCDIPISQEQLELLNGYFSASGATAIADTIRVQQPRDLADLCDIIKSQSVYIVPESGSKQVASIIDGRLHGQCTTFADATCEVLSARLSLETRTIDGKAILPGSSDITALGHRQVLVVEQGRTFILDTAPAGGPDMRSAGTRLRQAGRDLGRTLRSLFDFEEPLQDETSEDTPTAVAEPLVAAEKHLDSTDEPLSQAGETPSPEELAADRIKRSIDALSGINGTYRNQLIVWMNLDRSHQNPERLYRYMQQHHGSAYDPFQITLRQTIRATPRPGTFVNEDQFGDVRLTAELADLTRNIKYIENLKTKGAVSSRIIGTQLDTAVAESLQQTLRTIASHYQAILDARASLTARSHDGENDHSV